MLYAISRNMPLWANIVFLLAVTCNFLVALFYPFPTVEGEDCSRSRLEVSDKKLLPIFISVPLTTPPLATIAQNVTFKLDLIVTELSVA